MRQTYGTKSGVHIKTQGKKMLGQRRPLVGHVEHGERHDHTKHTAQQTHSHSISLSLAHWPTCARAATRGPRAPRACGCSSAHTSSALSGAINTTGEHTQRLASACAPPPATGAAADIGILGEAPRGERPPRSPGALERPAAGLYIGDLRHVRCEVLQDLGAHVYVHRGASWRVMRSSRPRSSRRAPCSGHTRRR